MSSIEPVTSTVLPDGPALFQSGMRIFRVTRGYAKPPPRAESFDAFGVGMAFPAFSAFSAFPAFPAFLPYVEMRIDRFHTGLIVEEAGTFFVRFPSPPGATIARRRSVKGLARG
jgi:hypothetical protein